MKARLKLVTAVAAGLLWAALGTAQDLNLGGESKPQQQEPAAPRSSTPTPQEPASPEPASPGQSTTPPAPTEQPKTQPAKIPTAAPEPCATCGDAASAKPTPRKRGKRRTKGQAAVGSQSSKANASAEASSGASSELSAAPLEKIVVRNGGAKDDTAQLSPGGGRVPDSHNHEATAQLLATTDMNLKKLASRQLTPTQQITLDQIRSYVVQAKSAADAGDPVRAHTLANKARLLSDDLSK